MLSRSGSASLPELIAIDHGREADVVVRRGLRTRIASSPAKHSLPKLGTSTARTQGTTSEAVTDRLIHRAVKPPVPSESWSVGIVVVEVLAVVESKSAVRKTARRHVAPVLA